MDAPATCRFCGKTLHAAVARCPHCGARLVKRAGAERHPPDLVEGGRAVFVRKRTDEARYFLIGLGAILLVLCASAYLTGEEVFDAQGDHISLFYLLVLNRLAVGVVGAGLLASGLAFWATGAIGFAYLGGVLWIAVALSPALCLLTIPEADRPTARPRRVSPLAGGRAAVGAFFWLVLAGMPLYHFRELAVHRKKLEPPDEDDGDGG